MQELGGYFFCHLEISHQIKGFPIETVCPFLPAQEDIKYRETIFAQNGEKGGIIRITKNL